MNPIRYTDAVPPTPDHFRRAMLDTLGGLEPVKRRHKFTTSLAVALAATLALAGMAFAAAQYGLLDFIFTDAAPGEGAEQAVRHVNVTAKGEYADFTVHDYIFDGRDLYANWTLQMHTDERLVLVSTGMDADFPGGFYCDQHIPDSLASNNPFTDTFPGGVWSSMNWGHFYDDEYTEPFDVTMQLALVRPDPDAVMVSATEECSYRDQPVWIYDDEVVMWGYGHYNTDRETGGDDAKVSAKLDARAAEVGYHQAWLEYFEEYGFGEVVERLSVSFTVVPGNSPVMRLDEPRTFALKDYAVTVESAEFTGFNAKIALSIELPEEVDVMQDGFSPVFTVLADGESVQLAGQMDGPAVSRSFTYDLWSQGGCSLLPSELTLIADDGEQITVQLSKH